MEEAIQTFLGLCSQVGNDVRVALLQIKPLDNLRIGFYDLLRGIFGLGGYEWTSNALSSPTYIYYALGDIVTLIVGIFIIKIIVFLVKLPTDYIKQLIKKSSK